MQETLGLLHISILSALRDEDSISISESSLFVNKDPLHACRSVSVRCRCLSASVAIESQESFSSSDMEQHGELETLSEDIAWSLKRILDV